MVSFKLSPLVVEETLGSGMVTTLPPKRNMAASKLNLVLVEGSKKSEPKTLPRQTSAYLAGSAAIAAPDLTISSISAGLKSALVTKLLIFCMFSS